MNATIGNDWLRPRFSAEDADRAYDEWGCNCGPAAIAAILGLRLADVRPHIPDFESRRYTNPSMMNAALRSLGVTFRESGVDWPWWGLVRIQWEGPWTLPGVPIRARYRYTHWVGSAHRNGAVGVFDVNCLNNGSGWVAFKDWSETVAPWLAKAHEARATGSWHVTHSLAVDREI